MDPENAFKSEQVAPSTPPPAAAAPTTTAPPSPFEYEFSADDVVIDPYGCDLNMCVDKECLLAYPLASEGFCSMWAGCRATHGVHSGRVAFEVHASYI
jgi:hypothetical protein